MDLARRASQLRRELRGIEILHRRNARFRLHRESDDGNFPEIDFRELAYAGFRIRAAFDGAEADGKTVERAGAHEREHLAAAFDLRQHAPAHEEAVSVLAQLKPDADRLGRIVLEEKLDAFRAALGKAFAKGTRQHEIAAEIGDAEAARIAGKRAVSLDRFQVAGDGFGFMFGFLPDHFDVFRARRAFGFARPFAFGFAGSSCSRCSVSTNSRKMNGALTARNCGGTSGSAATSERMRGVMKAPKIFDGR